MSFSQPFAEVTDEPADEWKIILASTFTAMGLMTLGLYFWVARKGNLSRIVNKNNFKFDVLSNILQSFWIHSFLLLLSFALLSQVGGKYLLSMGKIGFGRRLKCSL